MHTGRRRAHATSHKSAPNQLRIFLTSARSISTLAAGLFEAPAALGRSGLVSHRQKPPRIGHGVIHRTAPSTGPPVAAGPLALARPRPTLQPVQARDTKTPPLSPRRAGTPPGPTPTRGPEKDSLHPPPSRGRQDSSPQTKPRARSLVARPPQNNHGYTIHTPLSVFWAN
jgi:hypothetical protein